MKKYILSLFAVSILLFLGSCEKIIRCGCNPGPFSASITLIDPAGNHLFDAPEFDTSQVVKYRLQSGDLVPILDPEENSMDVVEWTYNADSSLAYLHTYWLHDDKNTETVYISFFPNDIDTIIMIKHKDKLMIRYNDESYAAPNAKVVKY